MYIALLSRIKQGCTNPARQVAMATELCMVAPNICGTTLRNLIHFTRVVPKVISNFFFACELVTADEGECGGRWNQLLCYP